LSTRINRLSIIKAVFQIHENNGLIKWYQDRRFGRDTQIESENMKLTEKLGNLVCPI